MLDLLISNARICDGTGAPGFVAGQQVYGEGRHTGAMPGRLLRSWEQDA